jgi:hypothetical protein
MRVTAWVEFSREIEVEIGRQEVLEAFNESPDPGDTWFTALNRFDLLLHALPDATIAAWTPAQRKAIGDFFTKHAARFQETPPSKIGWMGTSGTEMAEHDY